MRRNDREITDRNHINDIIAGSRYLHLGLIDSDYPYVVPLHYGYRSDEGKLILYIHCAMQGHKLDCITANPNVFVQIDRGEEVKAAETPCGYGARYESVMARGKASILNDDTDRDEKVLALRLLMKGQTGRDIEITENMAKSVKIIRVVAETITAKACK